MVPILKALEEACIESVEAGYMSKDLAICVAGTSKVIVVL